MRRLAAFLFILFFGGPLVSAGAANGTGDPQKGEMDKFGGAGKKNVLVTKAAAIARTNVSAALAAPTYFASQMPGVVTGTSVVNGTSYGTYNAAVLNAYTIPGNVTVQLDVSGTTTGTIDLGSNTTLELLPGVTLTQGSNFAGTMIENYHQTFVNLTGSAGTVSPLVSATNPLIGDSNISVYGAGTLIGNRYSRYGGATGTYTYNSPWGWTTTENCSALRFMGVANLYLGEFTLYGGAYFQIEYGNCVYPLIENVTVTKPGGVFYSGGDATDDSFHGRGSLVDPVVINCSSINNSDNSLTFSPGEDAALVYDHPAVVMGSVVNPTVENFYTNGNGPGFYCNWTGTGGQLEADIINPSFGYVVLDTPSPYYVYQPSANILSTMEFGANFIGGTFNDWTVGYRGTNTSALVGVTIQDNSSNLVFENWNFTAVPPGVSPFGFDAGGALAPNRSNIQILGCSATIIGGTSSAGFVGNGAGPGIVNGVTISNNLIDGFQGGVYADPDPVWWDAGQILNIGGTGNTILNCTGPPVTGYVTGVSGQLLVTSGTQAAENYSEQIAAIAGFDPDFQTTAAITAQSQMSAWIQGLAQLGVLQNCIGQSLVGYQGSPDISQLVSFGGLIYNPQIATGSFASDLNGGYFNAWVELEPIPRVLLTGSALTIFAVDNTSNTSRNRGILSLYNGDTTSGLSLEGLAGSGYNGQATLLAPTASGPTRLVSGTNGLSNQPVGYFAIYDGARGVSLRTMAMTGAADVTTTGTTASTLGVLAPDGIGLAGRGNQSEIGESTTLHDWMIVSGSLSPATETAVKTLWQNTIGAGYFPIPPYDQWLDAMFTPAQLANPAISGNLATPAGDGISNLMKYAVNLSPWANGARGLPTESVVTTGSGIYLTFTYTQVIAATDITYTPQVSNDLQTWNSGPGYITPLSVTTNPGGVTQTVTVEAATPIGGGAPRKFFRLLIGGQ